MQTAFKQLIGCLLFSCVLHPVMADSSTGKISLNSPPPSLGQWYKPANKRQVWLHTMFRLRRSMQAIQDYADQNNQAAMEKWFKRLDKDYRDIAEMVPEWENEIKPRLLGDLEDFIEAGDTIRIKKTLSMIKRTCSDCHDSYLPQVTILYRTPSYDDIKVMDDNNQPLSFQKHMKTLPQAVNRILIALDDGSKDAALAARQSLESRLEKLADSCSHCHKDDPVPVERILGKATQTRLNKLQQTIVAGQIKDSQKLMGELGVTVCSRCHGTHRSQSDIKQALKQP